MADPLGAVVSVRGEAQRTVTPDSAVFACVIAATRPSKPTALGAATQALDHLTAALMHLGGVPLTADTERHALTWSAFSTRTHSEHEHQPKTGRHEPTGQIVASVDLNLAVRDFTLLDNVGEVLSRQGDLHVVHVAWQVDDDNPSWPMVRADAIHAAVNQARHYTQALGGSLVRIEHIADAGLLGENHGARTMRAAFAAAHGMAGGDGSDVPSLDPVPQKITAAIEARFIADGMSINHT